MTTIFPFSTNELKNINIFYHFFDSKLGKTLIANTEKGVCFLAFSSDEISAFNDMKSRFPQANFICQKTENQQNTLKNLVKKESDYSLDLHLKGSDFQMKVWCALLEIPFGKFSTYAQIAAKIGAGKAYRAVGTAIGQNLVAYFIPCHRVLRTDGTLGGYHWGLKIKQNLIEREKNFV